MKGIKKLIVAAVCGIVSLTAVFGLSACQDMAGEPGKSAYEIAVDNGFQGTEQEWLDSLKGTANPGAQGKSAYDIWLENGHTGSEADFLEWLKGEDGKSAYDIWLEAGNQGSEEDFLEWLKGACGCEQDGGNQGGEDNENVVKDFNIITIQPSETYELSFEDVADGTYILSAKVESGEVVSGGLTATTAYEMESMNMHFGDLIYDMYGAKTNSYYCVRIIETVENIPGFLKKTVLTNNTETAMTLKVALKEYVAPEIKAGEEIEIPFIYSGAGYAPCNISSLAGGTYNITIKRDSNYVGGSISMLNPSKPSGSNTVANNFTSGEGNIFIKESVAIPEDLEIISFSRAADGTNYYGFNTTVLFEAVDSAASISFFSLSK